jgi:phage terminase small subunit
MIDEAMTEDASQPSAPKRDLTKAEVRQRQVANITHGGFVKAPACLRQRDGRVRRALAHLRKLAPWLKPSDLPAARSYCEMEILAKDMFADIRANGRVYTDEQGNIRSRGIIAGYRNLKRVSLAYARELGLTPVARKQFKLSFERERAGIDWVKLAYLDNEELGSKMAQN